MAEGRAPRINGHMLANVSYSRPALTACPSAAWAAPLILSLHARRPLPRELPWPARARGAAPSRPVPTCVCVCVCVCVCAAEICVQRGPARLPNGSSARRSRECGVCGGRGVWPSVCAWHMQLT